MNRVDRRDDIGIDAMEKLFNCPVHASLPNDYFSLHRVVTLGQPLGNDGDWGKAIENVAAQAERSVRTGRQAKPARAMKPALSAGVTRRHDRNDGILCFRLSINGNNKNTSRSPGNRGC